MSEPKTVELEEEGVIVQPEQAVTNPPDTLPDAGKTLDVSVEDVVHISDATK